MKKKTMYETEDFVAEIDLQSVNNILNYAVESGCEINRYQGSLLDNYIVYDAEELIFKISDSEPYNKEYNLIKDKKYILLKEKFLNEWSSITEITFTNDEQKVIDFEKQFEDREESEE